MKIHPSALKHGVLPEDAEQAASWPLWIEPLGEALPQRELRLGFDTQARLLETVVLILSRHQAQVQCGCGTGGDQGIQANARISAR